MCLVELCLGLLVAGPVGQPPVSRHSRNKVEVHVEDRLPRNCTVGLKDADAVSGDAAQKQTGSRFERLGCTSQRYGRARDREAADMLPRNYEGVPWTDRLMVEEGAGCCVLIEDPRGQAARRDIAKDAVVIHGGILPQSGPSVAPRRCRLAAGDRLAALDDRAAPTCPAGLTASRLYVIRFQPRQGNRSRLIGRPGRRSVLADARSAFPLGGLSVGEQCVFVAAGSPRRSRALSCCWRRDRTGARTRLVSWEAAGISPRGSSIGATRRSPTRVAMCKTCGVRSSSVAPPG